MKGYIGSLVSAKVATIGLQAATIALNTVISIGVSFLINAAIKKLDEWIETEEEVAESAENTISKYKEAQETLKSNKTTIDEISSEYETLSKGVDKFGSNISLSTAEYKRYLRQLAKTKPSLYRRARRKAGRIWRSGAREKSSAHASPAIWRKEFMIPSKYTNTSMNFMCWRVINGSVFYVILIL